MPQALTERALQDKREGKEPMEKISASKLLAGLVPAGSIPEEVQVESVTTDSREVRPGCIFVAFPGEKFDGHDFAAKALENGAVYVVVNHPVEGVPAEKAILCPDSYHAMMVMGANYRSQYKSTQITPVITLVLYFGTEKRWQYPQNLKALMDIPDGLESYVNDYWIHVFEIAWLADEQINMFQSDFRVVARYFSEKRKNKDYVPHDKTILRHIDAVLKLLAVMSGDHRYETILADPEQKGKVKTMDDALTRVINEGHARGLAEGRNEGLAEGLIKGQVKILVSLCRSGNISVEIAADQLKISTDEFRKYLDNDTADSQKA